LRRLGSQGPQISSPRKAMLTQRLHLVLVAASALGSRAAVPACAQTGYGYKSTILTVNGGFPEDASACQALCAEKTSCTFFTYYTDSKACWLQGAEAVRGVDTATSVSGPKECQPLFNTTQAEQTNQVAPNTVVVQVADVTAVPTAPVVAGTPPPLPGSVTLGPATLPVVTLAPATDASSTTFLAATDAPATTTTEASINITAPAAAAPAMDVASGTATVAADTPEVEDAESAVDIRGILHTWGWAIVVLALICVAVACTFCRIGAAKDKKPARISRGLEFQGQLERLEDKFETDTAPLMPVADTASLMTYKQYVNPMAPSTYSAAPAPMYVTQAPTVVTTPSISMAPATAARSVVLPAPASSVAMPMQTAAFGSVRQGPSRMATAFDQIDANHDGVISRAEFNAMNGGR